MKSAIIIATALAICLLSTSNAQEIVDRKEYGNIVGAVYCRVETEIDIFTEEEKHNILCSASEGLIENKDISFSASISSFEDDSILVFLIPIPASNLIPDIDNGNMLIRVDQNRPELIANPYFPESPEFRPSVIQGSIAIKDFLAKVKEGKQRLAIRIGTVTEAMPLNNQTTAAIEDFLRRTENLPAFQIQD